MINANKERLGAFFHGQVQYVVPFYQRSYVWDEENWEVLWDSIWNVYQQTDTNPQDHSEHFIGTLITKQRPAEQLGENKYDVIDGQQRLTTIALLLKAMAISANGELPNLAQVLEAFLSFSDTRGNKHLRILHSKIDAEYFEKLIKDGDIEGLENIEHKMIRAYAYFRNKLDGLTDEAIDTIMNIILNRVPVVSMLLAVDDDEQVIFDTINSLGVKLTTAELLKNYVFKERALQTLYDTHWAPTFEADEEQIDFWSKEKTSGRIIRSNIEVLLYCYLVIENKSEVKLETLFKEYKNWLSGKSVDNRKEFLETLKKCAGIYYEFPSDENINEISFNEDEKRFFHTIENLEITTIYPLVLFIYNSVEDETQRRGMLRLLESYLVRRNICRLTTKNYNNLFVEIIRALVAKSEQEHRELICPDLEQILLDYTDDTNIFPDDTIFKDGFKSSVLSNKHAKEVLFCIALKQKETPHADVQKLSANSLSVEHILPKKWETNWMQDDLSDAEVLARNKALKTLGNLTLVTKKLNSRMQNSSWENKKDVLRRYSSLEMTVNYLEEESWNEEIIDQRSEDLFEIAKTIWIRS